MAHHFTMRGMLMSIQLMSNLQKSPTLLEIIAHDAEQINKLA
jgi:hypothetical protein